MVDPCTPDSFNRTLHSCVHGECVNPVVKVVNGHETALHECKCNRGYSGPQCNTQVEERRKLAISYVLGPMISVLVVLCLLGCALFSFVLKGKRAMHGHYSPSHQEINGARMQVNPIINMS
uniref:EGF-like domain-containing protein n=1 Tax=Heterorhabditis bacteriophora TaxID=37862 RepID=A0A1I7XFH1_HETBA